MEPTVETEQAVSSDATTEAPVDLSQKSESLTHETPTLCEEPIASQQKDDSSTLESIETGAETMVTVGADLEESSMPGLGDVAAEGTRSGQPPSEQDGATTISLTVTNDDTKMPAPSTDTAVSSADVCPVCLGLNDEGDSSNASSSANVMLQTPCEHAFCRICIEQVLEAHGEATVRWPPSAPLPLNNGTTSHATNNADTHLMAPTLGRCPLCRAEISLFELQNVATAEMAYPRKFDWWSQLSGHIFVPYGRHATGNKSFHFPESQDGSTPCPYMDVSECIKSRPEEWKLADGDSVPPHLLLRDGHFHEMSRTFHGTIQFPYHNSFHGCHSWNVVLGISQNGKFLSSGVIVERNERLLFNKQPDETTSVEPAPTASEPAPASLNLDYGQMTRQQIRECEYPLEGDWKLVWHRDGQEKSSNITVRGNAYQQSKWSFAIHFGTDSIHTQSSQKESSPAAATIYWPKSYTVQTAIEGLDLKKQPRGPDIGQHIIWTTTNEHFAKIKWIRTSRAAPPSAPYKVTILGAGQDQVLYQIMMKSGPNETLAQQQPDQQATLPSIPAYHQESLWGNVFVKKCRIGQASYHFLSPDSSYLSYEHVACRNLPKLDDGTPLPTRLLFRNIEWDPSLLHLKATIEWEEDTGTSWNDNVRWKLDMTFDSQFMTILRGGIQCEWCNERRAPIRAPRPKPANRPAPKPIYVPPPSDGNPPPDRNEEWIMSGYGHDQLYINAACLERYRPEAPPVEDARATFDYYAQSFLQHRRRLKEEGATPGSINCLEKAFQVAAERPGANPIDYNIS